VVASAPLSLAVSVRARLSAMMFLQFFVWGAWFVTLSTYLGRGLSFSGTDIGDAYSTMPWGAIVAPFLVGMIADRFFAAEKVLGVLHLAGAVLLEAATRVTEPRALFWVLLAYALCYNPTLALVNAVAFNQMESPEKQFPAVRVFGTLGWIVAGLLVGAMGIEATALPLRIAALSSGVLGFFSFALPATPPRAAARG
jgi:nucleoside transporter